jgi:hypothetical protein
MFKKLAPVTREAHKNLKVKPIENFSFSKDFHIASVMVHEFVRAAAVYPIVFLEDAENNFRPVAMIGLEVGKNLFIDEDGKWQASYVPAIIRRYPFALAKAGEGDQYTVCLDEDASVLGSEDGSPLFDENGEPTAVIENVKKYLSELQQMEMFTNNFCSFLKENNLFTPLNMRVVADDKLKNITGCYVVNEERLNNMSDATFLDIKNRRYLPAIYAHLTSLAQIERLAMLQKGVQSLAASDVQEQAIVH